MKSILRIGYFLLCVKNYTLEKGLLRRTLMMATANYGTNSKKAHFTCIWCIENFSKLTYVDVKSPTFVAKSISDTKWFLHIDEYANFWCHIRTDDFSDKTGEGIDFEFSFLGTDGSSLISKRSSEPRLFLTLLYREDFLKRLAEFIPNNTLTVQCRMWKRGHEIEEADLCYVVTKLKMYTGSFVWPIEEFNALKRTDAKYFKDVALENVKIYPLKPLTHKGPFMSLIMYLKRNTESDDVCADFLIEKGRDYAYSCELSILDANGKIIESKLERGRLDYTWAILRFWPLISKNKLLTNKNLYLPNNTLYLSCSFEVCAGVVSNNIEYTSPNVTSIIEEEKEVLNFHVAGAEADESLEFGEYFAKK